MLFKRSLIQAPKFYFADVGLRSVIRDHPAIERRVIVCLEPRARRTSDGIDILPAHDFARQFREDRLV